MPDAISAAYLNAGAATRFFALGPIPPDAFLLSLWGMCSSSAGGTLFLSHVLTKQDAADAVAHAAGRRLLARSSVPYNTQPGYAVATAILAAATWAIPLNTAIPGGAAWIITRAEHTGALANWNVILSVTWLNRDEYGRIYGFGPPTGVVGVAPPTAPHIPAGPTFQPQ